METENGQSDSARIAERETAYLQQVRRDVKAEVLPVLLLWLHPLVEEHVGAVGLQKTTRDG